MGDGDWVQMPNGRWKTSVPGGPMKPNPNTVDEKNNTEKRNSGEKKGSAEKKNDVDKVLNNELTDSAKPPAPKAPVTAVNTPTGNTTGSSSSSSTSKVNTSNCTTSGPSSKVLSHPSADNFQPGNNSLNPGVVQGQSQSGENNHMQV
jgi:hypothetical protein